jgi:hypothetical protein
VREDLISRDPVAVVDKSEYQLSGEFRGAETDGSKADDKGGEQPPRNNSRMLGNRIPGVTPGSYMQPLESGVLFGISPCCRGTMLV